MLIIIALAILCASVVFVAVCYVLAGNGSKFIYHDKQSLQNVLTDDTNVGIVFGGGITGDGKPKPLLQERLDAAAELLKAGVIKKVIVSGDNRFKNYDEPKAMMDYLVSKKDIDAAKIQIDAAGRSTYETCERARKIFGLHKAVLISESTHLPRAIYLCRSFGVESYGYASTGWAADYLRKSQASREVMARVKAVLNVYVLGEKTILGPPITI